MSGHTPGKWEAVLQMDAYPGIPISIRSSHGNVLVAATQHEANARLIAAAPELLEALLGMIVSYELEASPLNPALLKARAALAKATGGAE